MTRRFEFRVKKGFDVQQTRDFTVPFHGIDGVYLKLCALLSNGLIDVELPDGARTFIGGGWIEFVEIIENENGEFVSIETPIMPSEIYTLNFGKLN